MTHQHWLSSSPEKYLLSTTTDRAFSSSTPNNNQQSSQRANSKISRRYSAIQEHLQSHSRSVTPSVQQSTLKDLHFFSPDKSQRKAVFTTPSKRFNLTRTTATLNTSGKLGETKPLSSQFSNKKIVASRIKFLQQKNMSALELQNSKQIDLLSKSISSTNFTANGTLPLTGSTYFGKTANSFRLHDIDGIIPHPPVEQEQKKSSTDLQSTGRSYNNFFQDSKHITTTTNRPFTEPGKSRNQINKHAQKKAMENLTKMLATSKAFQKIDLQIHSKTLASSQSNIVSQKQRKSQVNNLRSLLNSRNPNNTRQNELKHSVQIKLKNSFSKSPSKKAIERRNSPRIIQRANDKKFSKTSKIQLFNAPSNQVQRIKIDTFLGSQKLQQQTTVKKKLGKFIPQFQPNKRVFIEKNNQVSQNSKKPKNVIKSDKRNHLILDVGKQIKQHKRFLQRLDNYSSCSIDIELQFRKIIQKHKLQCERKKKQQKQKEDSKFLTNDERSQKNYQLKKQLYQQNSNYWMIKSNQERAGVFHQINDLLKQNLNQDDETKQLKRQLNFLPPNTNYQTFTKQNVDLMTQKSSQDLKNLTKMITHWIYTTQNTQQQLFLISFWKYNILLVQDLVASFQQQFEILNSSIQQRIANLFQDKNKEIARLKNQLKLQQNSFMVQMVKAIKLIRIARQEKNKAMHSVMDYQKNWKAMLSKQTHVERVQQTRDALAKLDQFITQSTTQKVKQVKEMEKIEKFFVKGLDFVRTKQSCQLQTDLKLLKQAKPSIYLPVESVIIDSKFERMSSLVKLTSLSDDYIAEQLQSVSDIAKTHHKNKLVSMEFRDAAMTQRSVRGGGNSSGNLMAGCSGGGGGRTRGGMRPSITAIGGSGQIQTPRNNASLLFCSAQMQLSDYTVMMLLNEKDKPQEISLQLLKFIYTIGMYSGAIPNHQHFFPKKILPNATSLNPFMQTELLSQRREASQTIVGSPRISQHLSGLVGADSNEYISLINYKLPKYIEDCKTGHPYAIMACKLLGVNGEDSPDYWVTNYFLQKRFQLSAFIKVETEEKNNTNSNNIRDQTTIQQQKGQGDSENISQIEVKLSDPDTPHQLVVDRTPLTNMHKSTVKLNKLFNFTKKYFSTKHSTDVAARILKQMQAYNSYISSLQTLALPIQWPINSTIGFLLNQASQNDDASSASSRQGGSSKKLRFKSSSSKTRNQPLEASTQISSSFDINNFDQLSIHKAFILILSIVHQLKKQDKDLKNILQNADYKNKGSFTVKEFKEILNDFDVLITQDDIKIIIQLIRFVSISTKRKNSVNNEPQDFDDSFCTIYVEYFKLLDIITQAKIKQLVKNYSYDLSVYELIMLNGIFESIKYRKEKLIKLFKMEYLESFDEQVNKNKNILFRFGSFLSKVYRHISPISSCLIFSETLLHKDDKFKAARTFSQSFYYYVSKEGQFEKGFLYNVELK